MSKTTAAIGDLRDQGYDDQAILAALCDGAALASLGLGDEDQTDIEVAADDLRKALASSAAVALGRMGGKAKSEAKAAAVRANGAKGGRPSGKVIATWSDDIKVGIWDNETWTLRLYEDRAVLKYPTVKWINNSGSLDYVSSRITGRIHAALLKVAADQVDDLEDYTERARELVWDEMH